MRAGQRAKAGGLPDAGSCPLSSWGAKEKCLPLLRIQRCKLGTLGFDVLDNGSAFSQMG